MLQYLPKQTEVLNNKSRALTTLNSFESSDEDDNCGAHCWQIHSKSIVMYDLKSFIATLISRQIILYTLIFFLHFGNENKLTDPMSMTKLNRLVGF